MFGLSGYEIVKQTEDADGVHLTAEILGRPADCKCGGKWNSNGKREVTIRDVNSGTKMVGVQVRRQKYICRDCKGYATQVMPHIDEGHLMTERLVEYIKMEATRRSFTDVADQIGMDEGTVRGIFEEAAESKIAALNIKTPRYMGLDEIRMGDKDLAVITNIEAATVYDIRPKRTAEELNEFFRYLPDRDTVEAIVIDDWKQYRSVISQWFACPIIVDKAHLIFRAGHAMEAARKKQRESLKHNERHLMNSDRLVLPARSMRSDEHSALLTGMLARFPVLAECRAALEGFWRFWDISNKETASGNLVAWQDSVGTLAQPHFKILLRTTREWHQEIVNFFVLPRPITNSITENRNDRIRDIAKAGRGYSFETLRNKVLMNLGVMKKQRKYVHASRSSSPSQMMGLSMNYEFGAKTEVIVELLGADLDLLVADLWEGMSSRGTSEILVDMIVSSGVDPGPQLDLFESF